MFNGTTYKSGTFFMAYGVHTMMRDEIFTFESFINWWGDLIGKGNLEDQTTRPSEHCAPKTGGIRETRWSRFTSVGYSMNTARVWLVPDNRSNGYGYQCQLEYSID